MIGPLRRERNPFGLNTPDQRGLTSVEVLIVVVILGLLVAGVTFAVGEIRERSHVRVCQTERRIVLTALEATRVTNVDGEFPGVAGADGFDRVREAGLFEWGTQVAYWHYVTPPLDGVLSAANLERVATENAPTAECQF